MCPCMAVSMYLRIGVPTRGRLPHPTHTSPCNLCLCAAPGRVPPVPFSPILGSAGNMRVELLNQSSLDLLRYDDGPYEAGGEKDQDPSLIPVPANSYFGMGTAEPGTVWGPPRPPRPAPACPISCPRSHPLSFSLGPDVGAGLLFVTNIDSSDPDQLVYKSPDPSEKVPGAAGDVPQNSYLGSYAWLCQARRVPVCHLTAVCVCVSVPPSPPSPCLCRAERCGAAAPGVRAHLCTLVHTRARCMPRFARFLLCVHLMRTCVHREHLMHAQSLAHPASCTFHHAHSLLCTAPCRTSCSGPFEWPFCACAPPPPQVGASCPHPCPHLCPCGCS